MFKKGFNIYKLRFLIVVLLLVLFNLGLVIKAYEMPIDDNTDYVYVTVKQGDTLWKILNENYDKITVNKSKDFRYAIDVISDINGGSDIYPGQTVAIPLNIY